MILKFNQQNDRLDHWEQYNTEHKKMYLTWRGKLDIYILKKYILKIKILNSKIYDILKYLN